LPAPLARLEGILASPVRRLPGLQPGLARLHLERPLHPLLHRRKRVAVPGRRSALDRPQQLLRLLGIADVVVDLALVPLDAPVGLPAGAGGGERREGEDDPDGERGADHAVPHDPGEERRKGR
jgi:hypothetical protein